MSSGAEADPIPTANGQEHSGPRGEAPSPAAAWLGERSRGPGGTPQGEGCFHLRMRSFLAGVVELVAGSRTLRPFS